MIDKISSLIDILAIEKEAERVKGLVKDLGASLQSFPKVRLQVDGANSVKQFSAAAREMNDTLAATKLKTAEAVLAQKELNLSITQARAEAKKAADEQKAARAAAKQQAAEQLQEGQAKIIQLNKERQAQDELNKSTAGGDFGPQPISNVSSGRSKQLAAAAEPAFVPQGDIASAAFNLAQQRQDLAANTLLQKELNAQVKSGSITQEQYNATLTQATITEAEIRADIKATNAELLARIKVEAAAGNSIGEAEAKVALLKQVQKQIPTGSSATPEDVANLKAVNAEIDRNNELIRVNNDELSKQKINIGNYQGAADSIVAALDKQQVKLQSLNSSYQTFGTQLDQKRAQITAFAGSVNSPEYKKLSDELKVVETGFNNAGTAVNNQRTVVEGFRRAADVAATSTGSLATQQTALKNVAVELGVQYGTESKVFQEVNAVVAGTTKEYKASTVAVKEAAEGSKGFAGGATKAYSALRTLANILPGIGIGTIFAFGIDAIESFLSKTKELTASEKLFSDVYKEGAKNASEQVAKLDLIKAKLDDISVPEKARVAVAKEYNKTAGEGNKIALDEIDNLKEINSQIDKQIGLIEKQALAKAAESKIATFADKAIEDQFKLQQALEDSGKTEEQVQASIDARLKKQDAVLKNQNTSLDGYNKANVVIDEKFKATAQTGIQTVELVDKKLEALLVRKKSSAQALEGVIKTLAPTISDDGLTGKGDTKKDTSLQPLKDSLDTQFEINKRHAERLLTIYEDEIKDDKVYYQDKLDALYNYQVVSKQLLDDEEKNAEEKANKDAARETQRLEEEKAGKNPAQIARINQNIAIVEKNLQEQLKNIRDEYADKELDLARTVAEKRDKINADQEKHDEQLEKDRLEFEQQTADQITKLREKLKSDIEKIEDAQLSEKKKRLDIEKKLVSDTTKGIEDIFNTALDDQQKKKQDAYDADIARIETRSQAEIASINASGLADTEKTRLVSEIEKRAAFDKETLDAKKATSEKRYQKVKKAAGLAEIAIETATSLVAISKAVLQAKIAAAVETAKLNPVGAAIALATIPTILAQIPGIIASAAINAAKIAFFKKGTQNAPKGPAFIGEEGRELVVETSGRSYLSPDGPTLTELAGGEKIFPANVTQMMIKAATSKKAIAASVDRNRPTTEKAGLDDQILKTLKNIERKSGIIINNNMPIETTAYYLFHIKH